MPIADPPRAWPSAWQDPRVITAAIAILTLTVALTSAQTLLFNPQFDGVAASAVSKPTPSTAPPPLAPQPVPNDDQPVVKLRLTKPAFGATLQLGSTVTIGATVTGQVSAVQFCVNGRPVGTAAASPYRVKWLVTKAGWFRITAMTVDGNGTQATASPVFVTVPRTLAGAGSPGAAGVPGIRRVKGRG